MNDLGNVRPLGIRCNHKTSEYSCCIYVGSVHACSLTRAHNVQSCTCPPGRFLHSPGHDCICESVRSGQYCMADTIASDTVPRNSVLELTSFQRLPRRAVDWINYYGLTLILIFFPRKTCSIFGRKAAVSSKMKTLINDSIFSIHVYTL